MNSIPRGHHFTAGHAGRGGTHQHESRPEACEHWTSRTGSPGSHSPSRRVRGCAKTLTTTRTNNPNCAIQQRAPTELRPLHAQPSKNRRKHLRTNMFISSLENKVLQHLTNAQPFTQPRSDRQRSLPARSAGRRARRWRCPWRASSPTHMKLTSWTSQIQHGLFSRVAVWARQACDMRPKTTFEVGRYCIPDSLAKPHPCTQGSRNGIAAVTVIPRSREGTSSSARSPLADEPCKPTTTQC